ncbi:cyclic nucleotide-binding domain-containing protein [Cupriavidus basilensis]
MDETLKEVQAEIRIQRFRKREFVVHHGTVGDSLMLLLAGRVQVIALAEDGREVGLDFVDPGDYFRRIVDHRRTTTFRLDRGHLRLAGRLPAAPESQMAFL